MTQNIVKQLITKIHTFYFYFTNLLELSFLSIKLTKLCEVQFIGIYQRFGIPGINFI